MPPNSAGSPGNARGRVVGFLSTVPWAFLFFEYVFIVPRYAKLFAQFGVKYTGMTECVMAIAAWIRNHLLIAFPVLLALMGLSAIMSMWVQTPRVSRRVRFAVLLTIFGVPCLLFALTWLGIDQTQSKLNEGLSK